MPEGWRRLAIEEMACQRTEKVRPARDDQTPYVALEHIPNGGGRLLGMDIAGSAMSHKTRFSAGDTLFGKLRPNLRKVVRAQFDGVCSTDILAVAAKNGTDAAFLYQLLASDVAHRHVMGDITGTKMPRTSWERLADLSVSCPSLPEQRAIAAVLDAVDDTIERTEAVIAATEDLRRSLLHELLTRGVPGMHSEWKHVPGLGTVPACWEVTTLGECLERIEAGRSPLCESRPARGDEWGVLKVSSVSWGEFRPNENKALLPEAKPDSRYEVKPGDLLLSRANTPDLVGRAVLVRNTPSRLLLSDKTLRLLPKSARTNTEFLLLALGTPSARTQISGAASGSSRSMFNVSQEALRLVRFALPSLDEQRCIAEALQAVAAAQGAKEDEIAEAKMLKATLAEGLLSGRVRVAI
ncbi:MAG: restriction endonuclease subunit S [Dehalococcoidia bacterium]